MYPRKGIHRFLNFFKVIILLKKLIKKNKNNQIVLFVRNEPIYLLACSFIKQKKMKLIFQTSFPHEIVSGHFIKRIIAKLMYKIGGTKVDSLLAISPKGLKRIQKILPHIQKGNFIPLLSDVLIEVDNFQLRGQDEKIRFIYIGDHSQPRKLEVVMRAIVKAYKKGLKAKFSFIGGKVEDINRLLNVNGVKKLKEEGLLIFSPRIPRKTIWKKLLSADVGLSLIPADEHYKEASPTKLSEYMAAGLAIVASNGIDLQEEFLKKSGAGVLCKWNEEAITDCLISIFEERSRLNVMKKKSHKYARDNLNYKEYVGVFKGLM